MILLNTEMDEDEPLNLSVKSNRSNPNAIIWSPASLCEKESANENCSIKVELDPIKTELSLHNSNLGNSSSASSSTSSTSSASTFLQRLQRRTNDTSK